MSWFRDNRRDAVFVAITVALPLFLFVYFALQLLSVRAGYQADIERVAPRVARLEGIRQRENELKQALSSVDGTVTNLVYPPGRDRASVAATMQKDVREILIDAGLAVANSQILPDDSDEGFEVVRLDVTVSGDLSALDVALAGLSAYRPRLMIESLDIWPERATRRNQDPGQTVTIGMQMMALKVRS
ncbi:general secretion pathway protein GspM [Parahaliea maris]|uniref:General secretion pathway protein GspM n=1 Tax=Parahaliea maris TaxID=2716870 RepID=A0A5C8ZU54_9GAMM|nr:type II secretion system protein GspM [Parahaliea maris]TXS91329.1 general secretion pathway protein GspM [Parahaliea maris]